MGASVATAARSEALALECQGLRVAFGSRTVLDGASVQVRPGESVAVMGPSGSGKTTLLACCAGLRRPDAGRVAVGGQEVSSLGSRARAAVRLAQVGIVFQHGELLPELTVAENVELPLRLLGKRDEAYVGELLARVGLGDRGGSMPAELSGGEVQRAAIARALVTGPTLLLADEPTGALDEAMSELVCELLLETARERGAGLVVATHDPLVAATVDRVERIRAGRLTP